MSKAFKRICVLVLDGFGIGELQDANQFHDKGSSTLKHVVEADPQLKLPHFESLGLFHAAGLGSKVSTDSKCLGFYSKMTEISQGKDTTTGHWEMMGLPVQKPFSYFPNGFPADIMDRFVKETGVSGYLGNKPASGTVIIQELGEEHLQTMKPIVYTSADSVFQIACHEEKFGLDRLYKICEITRKILNESPFLVGRVIARPFIGEKSGAFTRTGNRRDFSIKPFGETSLTRLKQNGLSVIGIGKIPYIYDNEGISLPVVSHSDPEGIAETIEILKTQRQEGLIFSNLNDLDTLYGHRRNAKGYAEQLERIDQALPKIMEQIKDDDLLAIVSDHGNDPTYKGTDHTREFVPLLLYSPRFHAGDFKARALKTRECFCDLGESIIENFCLKHFNQGKNFLPEIENKLS